MLSTGSTQDDLNIIDWDISYQLNATMPALTYRCVTNRGDNSHKIKILKSIIFNPEI